VSDGSGELLKKFKFGEVFIETGTYAGDGVTAAIKAGYRRIVSIELDDKMWAEARNRQFYPAPGDVVKIKLLWGPSQIMLNHPIIKDVVKGSSPTFMLDAHWCGEGTAGEPGHDPWIKELDCIYRIMNDDSAPWVVMIDDVPPEGDRGLGFVSSLIKSRWPDAVISYEKGFHPLLSDLATAVDSETGNLVNFTYLDALEAVEYFSEIVRLLELTSDRSDWVPDDVLETLYDQYPSHLPESIRFEWADSDPKELLDKYIEMREDFQYSADRLALSKKSYTEYESPSIVVGVINKPTTFQFKTK
jgi:hypothetical protein